MKKQTYEKLTELAGWYGVIAILVAYALLSFDVLDSHHLANHVINLTGGAGILIDAYADKNYQPVVLNVIWIAVAIYAISRAM